MIMFMYQFTNINLICNNLIKLLAFLKVAFRAIPLKILQILSFENKGWTKSYLTHEK